MDEVYQFRISAVFEPIIPYLWEDVEDCIPRTKMVSTPIAAARTAALSASVLQHRVTSPENFMMHKIIISSVLYAVMQK